MDCNRIFSIINEEIKIFEATVSSHAYLRIKERLKTMVSNKDITPQEAIDIDRNVNNIVNHNFNPNKSYGILLGKFNINPNSSLVTNRHRSGEYYEINSLSSGDVIRDSTGNEFWGIVRNNRLITIFLRKNVQRQTAERPRNMGGLGVDLVIDDFNQYLKNRVLQK